MPEFFPDHDSAAPDEFTRGYLACAEWLCRDDMASDTGEVSSERRDKVRGWTRAALKSAKADCAQFQRDHAADLEAYTAETGRDLGSAGHDLYLSRNGHGAGFFDRGNGAALDRLQDAARGYGEMDCCLSRSGWMRLGY